MKRKAFLRKSGVALIALNSFPFILPSGRLFAPTGQRIANHVVFCLFAGGIRNFESIQKSEGNLMKRILKGEEPISSDIKPGLDELPPTLSEPLQLNGTLYKEFRYKSTITTHYAAHAAAITGVYSANQPLMKPLNFPSVFEYYRKHSSPQKSAMNTWWISDQAGPFTFLNSSVYPGYGSLYGANMLQPTSFLNSKLNNVYSFQNEDYELISQLQMFFNKHAEIDKSQLSKTEIENSFENRLRLEQFLFRFNRELSDPQFNLWDLRQKVNEDILTMYAATKVLREFKPELLIMTMQHSDIGHANFTQYCNNISKADFAVYHLWKTIQETPGLKNDTVLILAPEFGRNLEPNTLMDKFGRLAVDHTGDENSQKIFCLITGHSGIVTENKEISDTIGETIDIVPTIAKILGFFENIPKGILKGRFLSGAFN